VSHDTGEDGYREALTPPRLAFCRPERQDFCMALEFTTSYVKDAVEVFRYYKKLADRAMEQVSDEALYTVQDHESNSIAIIVKHVGGNLRSRWTNFLTSDGEKPDRNRDSEFEAPPETRAALMEFWDSGWQRLFQTLESLTDDDLGRTIRIRGEAHSVMQAINRSITHMAYHVGQITCLAKHFSAPTWKPLTVPRGSSAEFNARVGEGKASQR
jgi:uncharacterized damage-inducible protein DinB